MSSLLFDMPSPCAQAPVDHSTATIRSQGQSNRTDRASTILSRWRTSCEVQHGIKRVPNSLHLCQETRLERKWKWHSWSTPKQFQQTARRGDKNEAIIVLDVPMDPLGVYSREHQAWPQNSVIGSTHFGGATPNFHPCEIDLRHPQESQKFLITMLCSDLGKQQNSWMWWAVSSSDQWIFGFSPLPGVQFAQTPVASNALATWRSASESSWVKDRPCWDVNPPVSVWRSLVLSCLRGISISNETPMLGTCDYNSNHHKLILSWYFWLKCPLFLMCHLQLTFDHCCFDFLQVSIP